MSKQEPLLPFTQKKISRWKKWKYALGSTCYYHRKWKENVVFIAPNHGTLVKKESFLIKLSFIIQKNDTHKHRQMLILTPSKQSPRDRLVCNAIFCYGLSLPTYTKSWPVGIFPPYSPILFSFFNCPKNDNEEIEWEEYSD